jgi:hypothetical protein
LPELRRRSVKHKSTKENPMKSTIALLPLVALLSACGTADGELSAGNWKNTMAMTKFEVPGAPPAFAEQAKTMLGKAQTTEACMTEAQAKAGVRDFSSSMQKGDCKMDDFQQGGGKMSGTMMCKGSTMGDTTMKMDGTYTTEKVSMNLTGEIAEKSLPGGKATVGLSITSERIGDCKS